MRCLQERRPLSELTGMIESVLTLKLSPPGIRTQGKKCQKREDQCSRGGEGQCYRDHSVQGEAGCGFISHILRSKPTCSLMVSKTMGAEETAEQWRAVAEL